MSKSNINNTLLQLILNMTKTEKRYFKLYSNRNSTQQKEFQFIALFNTIDKTKKVDLIEVKQAIPRISSKQLSDLKRHLYDRLLECLRVFHSKGESFKISTQVDKAKILYNKGLFIDALEILNKAKLDALASQRHLAVYEILDLEKKIESRHITKSHSSRSEELEKATKEIRNTLQYEAEWLEFSLKLYAKFIEKGFVKSQEEHEEITNYFIHQKPEKRPNNTHYFYERLYYHQSYGWYHFIIQNFVVGYKHSRSWIQLFEEFPRFKESHPLLLIKGLHNCLSVLFNCMDHKRHQHYLTELETFINRAPQLDKNTQLMAFIYLNNAKLNSIVLSGNFSKNINYIVQLEQNLLELDVTVDSYRLMVFWYRMASIYFTIGDYNNCNRLLNKIINPNQKKLREDLQCFSRLLNIISHFELGNDELLSYSIKSTYRFLLKMNEVMQLHKTIIDFLKVSLFKQRSELKPAFIQLKSDLEPLSRDPFERRSFLYLDIISWLESKIEHKSVEYVIYRKRSIKTD